MMWSRAKVLAPLFAIGVVLLIGGLSVQSWLALTAGMMLSAATLVAMLEPPQ